MNNENESKISRKESKELHKRSSKEPSIPYSLFPDNYSLNGNTREASMAQSKKDFIAKMQISLKEAAETQYWLELLIATDTLDKDLGRSL